MPRSSPAPLTSLGVDTGGTFTDLVLVAADGTLHAGKLLSTPEAPERAILEGARQLCARHGLDPARLDRLAHGTTLIANALIEGKGPPVGLLTTEGFRDILEIGREGRYDLYDLFLAPPPPLVPRFRRREVRERCDETGAVRTPLNRQEVEQAARALVAQGIEALAIVFLHSYRNPNHERRAAAVVRRVAPHLTVCTSSEVCAEIREYERTATTAANAAVMPLASRYLARLEEGLAALGCRAAPLLMQSHGGTLPVAAARRLPIRLVESGPAGGVVAATALAREAGIRDLLAFDMGGTTAKSCFVTGGEPLVTQEAEVARVDRFKRGSGYPLRIPSLDLIEIGAGGGSIAAVDALGLLTVGPRSAGARPGPACYGQGGQEATVTDADLVLGFLDPDYFLGGAMPLDGAAAGRAVSRLARRLRGNRLEAAWGIHEVVTAAMADAARLHAAERGLDPTRFALVASGGAGPVHACRLAERLGITTVCFPPRAGVLSALGLLLPPVRFDAVRSRSVPLAVARPRELAAAFREMAAEGIALHRAQGTPRAACALQRTADLRYQGQGSEVTIPLPPGNPSRTWLAAVETAFARAYRRRYGRTVPGRPVELVSLRLAVTGPAPRLRRGRWRPEPGAARLPARPVFDPRRRAMRPCPVFHRPRLGAGRAIRGPAILQEVESTIVLHPGWTARVRPDGMIVARRSGRRGGGGR